MTSQMLFPFASVETPAETLHRLNLLSARRDYIQAKRLQSLFHGRALVAIRKGDKVNAIKEEARWEWYSNEVYRKLDALTAMSNWYSVWPRRK